MILVDDAGGEWPMIGHAPWNGCNLADFVMPFFLFIVGMAIALSLKVGLYTVSIQLKKKVTWNGYWYAFILVSSFVQRIPNRLLAIKKVLLRTLKLLFWGLLLQGQFFFFLVSFLYLLSLPAPFFFYIALLLNWREYIINNDDWFERKGLSADCNFSLFLSNFN